MLRRMAVAFVAAGTVGLATTTCERPALADPCGMVPPISVGNDVPIARVGEQQTYVFFQDGIETFVIRPGFTGKVEEFGMLIPFPAVPAIRKVSDNIFPHLRAAVDPPEVVVDVRVRFLPFANGAVAPAAAAPAKQGGLALREEEVRVVKEEAVGMYEVAVLEAGSAAALQKWMDEHGYKYPKGMDVPANEYVQQGWCFVAVKTKVGQKKDVDPRPGMRNAKVALPAGSTFDGHVQAMGFRFETPELVVPMRLSTFNEGDLRNIVFLLSKDPSKIRSIPEEYVVRQIPGLQLRRNVTDPLPLRIVGGTEKDLQPWQKQNLPQQRDPAPHNGAAKDLFASDLLAVAEKRLSHPHEEAEKMLLRIGERLGLRGPDIDRLNEQSLEQERKKLSDRGLAKLDAMTLSLIDGQFPREVLAAQNLKFAPYTMPARRNRAEFYDATRLGPAGAKEGTLYFGPVGALVPARPAHAAPAEQHAAAPPRPHPALAWAAPLLSALAIGLVAFRRSKNSFGAALLLGVLACAVPASAADETKRVEGDATKKLSNLELVDRLKEPKLANEAAEALIARGEKVVPDLLGEALEGNDFALRGWAIVCLSEIGGPQARQRLKELHEDAKQPELVRTWAAAGLIHMATTQQELLDLANLIPQHPAIGRPIGIRLLDLLKSKGDGATAEDVLNVTIKVPQLQQSLGPAVLAMGPAKLVEAMATAKDDPVRRQAAAYLGTLAAQGEDAVPSAVIAAYKFDPQAKQTPWHGGALFIPGIQWGKDDAKALVGSLVRWYLWCELKKDTVHQRPTHNNLASVQLASVAGYQINFQQANVDGWLTVWGKAAGKDELRKILEEQKVADDPRYKKILDGLK